MRSCMCDSVNWKIFKGHAYCPWSDLPLRGTFSDILRNQFGTRVPHTSGMVGIVVFCDVTHGKVQTLSIICFPWSPIHPWSVDSKRDSSPSSHVRALSSIEKYNKNVLSGCARPNTIVERHRALKYWGPTIRRRSILQRSVGRQSRSSLV